MKNKTAHGNSWITKVKLFEDVYKYKNTLSRTANKLQLIKSFVWSFQKRLLAEFLTASLSHYSTCSREGEQQDNTLHLSSKLHHRQVR